MRKWKLIVLAAALALLAGCAVPASAGPDALSSAVSAASAASAVSSASDASVSAAPEDSAPENSAPEVSAGAPSQQASSPSESGMVRVTIPEGFTVLQICARLEAAGVCSGQEFFEVSQTYVPSSFTVPEDENRAYKMEGYLFPATYEFPTDSDPTDVLIAMLNAYRANAGDLTDEQLIVASIVERESRSEENAALVASVIYNRLEAGMPLQMDSTREYVNASITDSPYLSDTERFAALYNTYKCGALPAGPICCPGSRAINAALNPADTDYYYFFFGSDNQNHYSSTFEEHQSLIAQYGVQYN